MRNQIKLVFLGLTWLALVAVIGASAVYAQGCYNYGYCQYPLAECFPTLDAQCSMFGADVMCEVQLCESYCGTCYKRRCEQADYACWLNYCGTWICV